MANHTKPTQEELDQNIQKAQEEAESLMNKEEDSATEDQEEEVVEETGSEQEEDTAEEEVDNTTTEDEDDNEPDTTENQKDKPDYEKKFSESSKEAQKLHAKNRRLDKGIEEATDIPEPTEEDLVKEFGETYELASDAEKISLTEAFISRESRRRLKTAREEAKRIEKWESEVNEYAEDPETLNNFPELEGKVDAFKEYALDEKRNSIPFDVLVSAFLHETSKSAKPVKKGKMFDTGSGGPNEKPKKKDGKLTIDEARKLRQSSYTKYTEYLKAGKIDQNVI